MPSTRALIPIAVLLVGACSLGGRTGAGSTAVVFAVENAAQVPLRVEACAPNGCAEPRVVEPGRRTRFAFALPQNASRFNITGWHGNRVAVRRALDILEPGTIRVVLDPSDPTP